jgi:hypothetical protein
MSSPRVVHTGATAERRSVCDMIACTSMYVFVLTLNSAFPDTEVPRRLQPTIASARTSCRLPH